MQMDVTDILRAHGLRDTRPRRLILSLLHARGRSMSQESIHRSLVKKGEPVNLVTIYRALETFRKRGIVHPHPATGGFLLCELPGMPGHHGFLSCDRCGVISEFIEPKLCALENTIATRAGFHPKRHVSEIVGICSSCQ